MKKALLILALFVNNCCAQEVKAYFKPADKPPKTLPEEITDSMFVGNDSVSMQLNYKAFRCNTYFDATFLKPAKFYTSIFYKDVIFTHSKFKDIVDFSGVEFYRDITFSSSSFDKILFMSGIRADSIAVFNFYRATLPDLIDFSHNKTLWQVVDFTDANFDNPKREKKGSSDTRHFINIYNSDITKLKLDYLHFRLCFYDPKQKDTLTNYLAGLRAAYDRQEENGNKSKTLEDDAVYKQLTGSSVFEDYIKTIFPSAGLGDTLIQNFAQFYCHARWFPARLSNDQTEALYSRLLKNFDTYGQKMSYKLADIDRNNFISGYWNISRHWNKYGYNKEWIFWWTAGFLLLFTGITYWLDDALFEHTDENEVVYDVKNMPVLTKSGKFLWAKKLVNAFIYTSIIFFSFGIKTENINFKKKIFYYIVIVNVAGLLCLGYLANFILQK